MRAGSAPDKEKSVAAQTPEYEVLKKEGPIELRRYAGYLTANVRVGASSYGQATNAGFNPLAEYIFGSNHASDRIAMTAPVSAGRACCQKIAMTAPVTAAQSEDEYVVSFTMPSGYSMEDLPLPNDPRVTLESVDSHVVAAVSFSGYFSETHFAKALDGLEAWMQAQGLTAAGEPISAQYDAPWKPGFARHNEVMIPVSEEAVEVR
jgi:hypothetical protein